MPKHEVGMAYGDGRKEGDEAAENNAGAGAGAAFMGGGAFGMGDGDGDGAGEHRPPMNGGGFSSFAPPSGPGRRRVRPDPSYDGLHSPRASHYVSFVFCPYFIFVCICAAVVAVCFRGVHFRWFMLFFCRCFCCHPPPPRPCCDGGFLLAYGLPVPSLPCPLSSALVLPCCVQGRRCFRLLFLPLSLPSMYNT